jgi:signal transduction histidine kinase
MPFEHIAFPRALSLAVHELRTPVTVTAGYLRMLLREQAGPLSERQRKMLEEAERSCGRINALITEMSELGKLTAGELTPPTVTFDLAALVAEVASSMQEGSDRGIHVDVRATSPVIVAGDRARLGAAVRALVHATVRERAEPGVVVVSCATVANGDRPWAVVTIGDDAVTASLCDSALTTSPPSFDEWRGGLGLALPVGRCVIEAHGGAVWSAPGNPRAGSALRLPLVKDL